MGKWNTSKSSPGEERAIRKEQEKIRQRRADRDMKLKVFIEGIDYDDAELLKKLIKERENGKGFEIHF